MRSFHSYRRLCTSQDGGTAIEFALVSSLLFMLTLAIIEYSYMMFIASTLESAVLSASRFGITGRTIEGVTRDEVIRDIINERTFGLVPTESITIETKVYPSFDKIEQAEPFDDQNHNGSRDEGESFTDVNGNGVWDSDMGAAGLGGPGDVVLYTVDYTGGALTKMFTPILGDIRYHATVAVRNEPFES